MTHAGLFSGIGGFSLAAQWVGWTNVFDVEIDEWCRKVLHKNFPTTQLFADVCTFDGLPFRGTIDVLSGGFPCQDLSKAGRGAGLDGAKSSLWFEFERIIRDIRPGYVVIENSPRLLVRGFERVLSGLACAGYDAKWAVVPASRYGAPHERERLYVLAYAHRLGRAAVPHWPECLADDPRPAGGNEGAPRWNTPTAPGFQAWLPTLTGFHRLDDGLSLELGSAELHGYGNAIVPDCALEIFHAIQAAA